MRAATTTVGCAIALAGFLAACDAPEGTRATGIGPTPAGDGTLPEDPFANFTVDAGVDASIETPTDAAVDARVRDASSDAAVADGSADAGPAIGVEAVATRFAIPGNPLASGGAGLAPIRAEGSGWTVVDLDGDGVQDLVQTAVPTSQGTAVFSDTAGPYWRFFKGDFYGFAATSTRFGVPASGLADGFFASTSSTGPRQWLLVDTDGDKLPDLVQTADVTVSMGAAWHDGVGAFWRVYKNTLAGFEAIYSRWSTPASGLSDGFYSSYSATNTKYWFTRDLDGDGTLELVQTANPLRPGGFVFSDGAGVYWRVFRSYATGFSGTAERFAVPTSGLADGFFASTFASTAPGTRFWFTADVTGDGIVDLVHTADPDVSGGFVWTDAQGAYWKFNRGEVGGFSAIDERLRMPASGLADGFFSSTSASASGANGSRFWTFVDIDGDKLPELVQTADPTKVGGAVFTDAAGAYWKVFRLRVGASTPVAERFSLPASGRSDGFFTPQWVDGTNGRRAWFFRDIDGDGKLDLVQTADPSKAGPTAFSDSAGSYWNVWFAF